MGKIKKNLDNSAPPLAVHLFGSIEIQVQGLPLPRLHSRKGLWLLALLTLRQGKPVERDWLVGTLWPESSQSQSLAYLRHCLTELRHALGTEAVRLQSPTRQTLALDLAGAEVDTLTFDVGIEQGDPAALQRAVAMYRGPLLHECSEEWALAERRNREHSYLAALQGLSEDALARGDAETAIGYSRRLIGVDALQEGAQRTLMQALAATGQISEATQVYRDLRLHLHRELNAEPDPKTTALYNRLRAQTQRKAMAAREVAPSLSTAPPPRRLPRPLTDLLGRDAEVLQVAARLRQRRLVTLTGTGGLGKTRLAIAVAETMVEEFADGAWFVELAGISDAGLVAQSVATTLGVRDEPGRSLHDGLLSFLQPRLLLLVLDNCEHLLQACAQLASALLDGCSGVRILATSRQALGITGEVNWPVPLLPVPDLTHLPTEGAALLTELSEVASVQLFVERAEAMQKEFALTTRNALWIARICERLDGIPLALELAAGNVKVLPIEQIALRLDDVFRLLTRGSRTALPRQQTLQATLDWSYALLTEPERTLLQRLSVFAGGWTLEAAEQVCSDCGFRIVDCGSSSAPSEGRASGSESDPRNKFGVRKQTPNETSAVQNPKSKIQNEEVLDVLTSLVDKSLVQVAEREDCLRYRMLEVVRQYAWDRLVESGESDAARARHRDTFLALAEEAAPKLMGAEQGEWLAVLETEHDNVRQALAFCLEEAEGAEAGLRLGAAMWRFWVVRGHFGEGREHLAAALARAVGPEQRLARTRALNSAGSLAVKQGDYTAARALLEESLAIRRELGDRRGIAVSLANLGAVASDQGDYGAARVLLEESLAISREVGNESGSALTLYNLGIVAYKQGDYGAARALLEESLAILRKLGDKSGSAESLNSLGNVAQHQGDYSAARALYEESLTICREFGNKSGSAESLTCLGIMAAEQGDYSAVRALFEESLAIRRELGDRQGIAISLHNLGELASDQGDYSAARALYEESLMIFRELGNKSGIASALDAYASINHQEQHGQSAARLWGATTALREAIGSPRSPHMGEKYDKEVAETRSGLGELAFAAAWEEGRAMTMEQANAYALKQSDVSPPGRSGPG